MNTLSTMPLDESDINYVDIKEEYPDYVISLIPVNYLYTVWDDAKPYLEKAVKRSGGRWTVDYVHEALLRDEQQLWVTLDKDNKLLGVATTQFVRYPASLMCSIQYIGGDEFKHWAWLLCKKLEAWDKDSGCDGIEGTARFGFWKWLSRSNWKKAYTIFEKRFDND